MRPAQRQPGAQIRVIEPEGSDPDTWIVGFRDRRIDGAGAVLAVIGPEEGINSLTVDLSGPDFGPAR
ncbi:hypothetical protein ACFVUH_30440 [Kitasatospora sp. NPDC058032]|uniref:hypothetical protein n=1 Tax=Kitasatospora sp. NPDC058032 TaxID=3346307 RepID=UPI0036DEFD1C